MLKARPAVAFRGDHVYFIGGADSSSGKFQIITEEAT
jgi:hypothetical protein